MLNRFQIYCIPYGIDTKAYQPLERQICRSVLGIPASKNVLMFGAKSFKNSRKGSDLLLKALSSLPDSLKKETVLLTIGSRSEEIPESCSIPAINLGYLENERLQSLAYPIFHKLCTLLNVRSARRMKLRLVSERISRFERLSSWRNSHCCNASKLAKFNPLNRALSSCHKRSVGPRSGLAGS